MYFLPGTGDNSIAESSSSELPILSLLCTTGDSVKHTINSVNNHVVSLIYLPGTGMGISSTNSSGRDPEFLSVDNLAIIEFEDK